MGFLSPVAGRLYQQRDKEVLFHERVLLLVNYFSGKHLHELKKFTVMIGKPLCACGIFFYCIEEQPQLKFTLIIKYSERIITGVKIKLAKLYFFLFLLSSSQMLQP